MSYLILDIETIPDFSIWTPPEVVVEPPRVKLKDGKPPTKGDKEFLDIILKRLAEKQPVHPLDVEKAHETAEKLEDAEPQKAILTPLLPAPETPKDAVAPVYAQRPIVIGCLWLDEKFRLKRLGSIDVKKYPDEYSMLLNWSQFMSANQNTTIVTWNGNSFDLPCLYLRCLRWGVPLRWFFAWSDYRYRYSESGHCDLMDVMASYGAVNRTGFKLDALAKMTGLPGKYGIDGSMVADYYAAGRIDEIITYCQTDVVQTGLLFLRWQLIKGKISLVAYRECAGAILGACRTDSKFADFVKLIDEKSLLLSDIVEPAVEQVADVPHNDATGAASTPSTTSSPTIATDTASAAPSQPPS